MQSQIMETYLVSSIISLDFVTLNSAFYRKRIVVIESQCVNKCSQDLRHY